MAAETNITTTGDLAKVQSIDFVNTFGENIKKLTEALGITRKLPVSSGTVIKTYKASKDVKKDAVAEGEIIPLSKVTTVLDKTYEIAFDKYRKAVTAEAIQKHGFDQAVTETDDKLLKEVQRDIRKKLFDFMATGTGKASGVGLQAALAQAWGQVQSLFEDDGVTTVCFVNPLDVADYIASANVTTQNVFGMTIISGFTDVTIITNTSVPKGKVYATAPDNLVLAYAPVSGSELSKAFTFTTDDTGYIGITHNTVNNNLTYETVVMDGVLIFAERIDGVVVVTINAPASNG
ncbi:MAG: hypothetical protein LKJ50_01740 [Clostridiales bacterium]|jgi:hypothetical protein|nr:hypothetical protein [Clostridiales bacterium]MCI1951492.1 hypothetical protein [Clostridiales bacterium]MCI1960621.1 hypothetical protein [Clostridiales bacterium]MCI1960667.1 hypothetical protein [Clostridiales bacterium]MCI2021108.1 hypothetical protein [Clostridiales bacterium]